VNNMVEIEWPDWHCDGKFPSGERCEVKGSLWKVEQHILIDSHYPNEPDRMKPVGEIYCWGAYAIGSPAEELLDPSYTGR